MHSKSLQVYILQLFDKRFVLFCTKVGTCSSFEKSGNVKTVKVKGRPLSYPSHSSITTTTLPWPLFTKGHLTHNL